MRAKKPGALRIGGEPAEIYVMQMAYMDWLQKTALPKLLTHTNPGLFVSPEVAACYRDRLQNTEIVNIGPGLHCLQEDRPSEIGAAIAPWMERHDF
jgi:haloalkane dehalogenase